MAITNDGNFGNYLSPPPFCAIRYLSAPVYMPENLAVRVIANAPRFTLTLPMRYRPAGHPEWRNAKTANVSSSGVLFEASEPLQVGGRLEIEISMTAALSKPSRIVATSEVVRQGSETQPLITAVQHLHFHMMDGDLE